MKKAVFFLFLLFLSFNFSVYSTQYFDKDPISVLTGADAWPFDRCEALIDRSPEFKPEKYHEKTEVSHTKLLKLLNGNTKPNSNIFVLHYAKNWDHATKQPILLVHGAGDTAYRAWYHVLSVEVESEDQVKFRGLLPYLVDEGYPVFAITFPQNHGDNFYQSEHIANAISKIRSVLRKDNDKNFKVNIITHSKGGVCARMYISSIRDKYNEYKWLTPFRKDVERFITIANPLKGVDTMYRYYGYNLTVMSGDTAAPLGPNSMIYYSIPVDLKDYNDQFTGQLQILHNWVNDDKDPIPLSLLSVTPFDYNYTENILYHGGISTILTSNGIDAAIEKGKDLIHMLNEQGADPSVKIAVLAGNNNIMDYVDYLGFKFPLKGETADESDGLLFVKSATYTDGILCRGAKLIDKKVMNYNHITISCNTPSRKLILKWLKK